MEYKFTPCRICGTKEGPIKGYYYDTEDGFQIIRECSCHGQWRRISKIRSLAEKANIWSTEEFLTYHPSHSYVGKKSLSSIDKLEGYLENIVRDKESVIPRILYFQGDYGTQKTHIAQWLGLELIRKKITVKYLMMNTLIKILADDLPSEEKNAKIDEVKSVDVLIIDEAFQKEKMTIYKSGYQLPFIEIFIRERLDLEKKGTIFISNVPPTKIKESGMSDSLQDFVVRNTISTLLLFEDNYMRERNPLDIQKDIFSRRV